MSNLPPSPTQSPRPRPAPRYWAALVASLAGTQRGAGRASRWQQQRGVAGRASAQGAGAPAPRPGPGPAAPRAPPASPAAAGGPGRCGAGADPVRPNVLHAAVEARHQDARHGRAAGRGAGARGGAAGLPPPAARPKQGAAWRAARPLFFLGEGGSESAAREQEGASDTPCCCKSRSRQPPARPPARSSNLRGALCLYGCMYGHRLGAAAEQALTGIFLLEQATARGKGRALPVR